MGQFENFPKIFKGHNFEKNENNKKQKKSFLTNYLKNIMSKFQALNSNGVGCINGTTNVNLKNLKKNDTYSPFLFFFSYVTYSTPQQLSFEPLLLKIHQ